MPKVKAKTAKVKSEIDLIRERAENDLFYFAKLVNPTYQYGEIHKKVAMFLSKNVSMHGVRRSLLLLPRGHLKSHWMANYCAWEITKNPAIIILYLSATAKLATTQLFAIKQILSSDIYKTFWPLMLHREEGKRKKWTSSEIIVDHPLRAQMGIRDATVSAAGLTATTTGWHADLIIPDDVVVPENAYTLEGREKVASSMSQMSSILNAGGMIKACGTRYHPNDQYGHWSELKSRIYDEEGEFVAEGKLWDIFQEAVEEDGVFLWPRKAGPSVDGRAPKFFGFNKTELEVLKLDYINDMTQFYAQYYNDPNDPDSQRVDSECFQYYNRDKLVNDRGTWFYDNKILNIYAAVDFAWSLNKKSDYTAIVVLGIDSDGFIYVLEIDRFQSDRIATYFSHIKRLHSYWRLKRLRAEVSNAQAVIVSEVKEMFRNEGISLVIEEYRPNRYEGSKEERIAAALEPKYIQRNIWHFKGGHTPVLEEEVLQARPKHDDIKDAFASALCIAVRPKPYKKKNYNSKIICNKYGGSY